MTEPVPIPPNVAQLDQALVNASYELVRAHRAEQPDPERIEAARKALEVARDARWPNA